MKNTGKMVFDRAIMFVIGGLTYKLMLFTDREPGAWFLMAMALIIGCVFLRFFTEE